MPKKSKDKKDLNIKTDYVHTPGEASPVAKMANILQRNPEEDIWFSEAHRQLRNDLISYYEEIEKKHSDKNSKHFALWRLAEFHLRTENYLEFLKTYRRLNREYDRVNPKGIPINSAEEHEFNDVFSNMLMEEVSRKTRAIYGNNAKQRKAFVDAINYGLDDEPCLIIGETGTGKEIIAELIHQISSRKGNKYSKVNCGGFTESLFNAQIRGIAPYYATGVAPSIGAFLNSSGRINDQRNKGYYIDSIRTKSKKSKEPSINCMINGQDNDDPSFDELAPLCGTLFLDEVNSLPFGFQSSLLRIIQEKEVQLIGENRKRRYAAKVICATNKELTGDEKLDGFRRDLFYRLAKGIIYVPPLRGMPDAIPSIARDILNDLSNKFGYTEIGLTNRAEDKLIKYQWPGNHRELENVMYRAFKDLIIDDRREIRHYDVDLGESPTHKEQEQSIFHGKDLYQVNKMYVDYLLNQTDGDKTEATRLGGFGSPKQIYEILNPKDRKYRTRRYKSCPSLVTGSI